MKGFGVHTSMWTMEWTPGAAEKTVEAAVYYKMDFIATVCNEPTKKQYNRSKYRKMRGVTLSPLPI